MVKCDLNVRNSTIFLFFQRKKLLCFPLTLTKQSLVFEFYDYKSPLKFSMYAPFNGSGLLLYMYILVSGSLCISNCLSFFWGPQVYVIRVVSNDQYFTIKRNILPEGEPNIRSIIQAILIFISYLEIRYLYL